MADLAVADSQAPLLVVGTPAHQMHELGAMLAATTAASSGWRVAYLGPNLPADELARAVRFAKASALALSVVYPTDDPELPDELRALRKALPPEVGLIFGGSGAQHYADTIREIGAEQFSSLVGMRQWLRVRAATVLAGRAAR
jgi:methylmalonyl-CoA mutase cobalamin-binding subunit